MAISGAILAVAAVGTATYGANQQHEAQNTAERQAKRQENAARVAKAQEIASIPDRTRRRIQLANQNDGTFTSGAASPLGGNLLANSGTLLGQDTSPNRKTLLGA